MTRKELYQRLLTISREPDELNRTRNSDAILKLIDSYVEAKVLEALERINTIRAGEDASNDTIARHVTEALSKQEEKEKQ